MTESITTLWPPKVIYLTTEDDDMKVTGDKEELTWCEDRISTHDIQYVRADLKEADRAIRALKERQHG